jgi:hypothetical protein
MSLTTAAVRPPPPPASRSGRESLLLELGTVRDAAVRTTQALADSEAQRSEAAEAAAAARAEFEAVTAELVEVKMQLAAAQELEVLFKRDVFKSKRMLHGLPQEWALARVTGSSGGGGGEEVKCSRVGSGNGAGLAAAGTL